MFGDSYTRLTGRLGRDVEAKSLQSGRMVANASLATDESYMPKDGGERVKKTTWHRVVAFGKTAEILASGCKGQLWIVEGAMQYREWEKDGVKRTSAELVAQRVYQVVVRERSENGGGSRPSSGGQRDEQRDPVWSDDSDIPF